MVEQTTIITLITTLSAHKWNQITHIYIIATNTTQVICYTNQVQIIVDLIFAPLASIFMYNVEQEFGIIIHDITPECIF